MIDEEIKAAQEQVGTVRWYIENKWGDPEQKDNAYSAVTRLSNMLYGVEESYKKPALPVCPTPTTGLDDLDNLPAKVALVVGHNQSASGAWVNSPIDEPEFVFNSEVADILVGGNTGDIIFKKFKRTPGGGYTAEINRVYAEVNEWDPDFIVELHFNGGEGDYTCMLAAESSPASQDCAEIMSEVFASSLNTRDAGVFKTGPGDRGGKSLHAGRAYTVLSEPFFGDNQHHADLVYALGHSGIAYIYMKAISKALHYLQNR
tara:strand:+ start:6609 stop:7388 length:780 start_codon:yes stop_codon:yes gene_type:complete